MKTILDSFSSAIKTSRQLLDESDGERRAVKWEVVFMDDSRLIAYESSASFSGRFKYNYHWMRPENELLIRWDNNPHYQHLSTFPHHLHAGSDPEARVSEPMTLQKVLPFIAA
ncbi:MAG: DUF6516 family protein [Cytophagaceae bacterium]|nr:DUF6516 family protein [Cytophagaceae bacterium]